MTKAVFFDVDFTLIYPGPAFQGDGYQGFCAKHGMTVNAGAFEAAVNSASRILDEVQDSIYDPQLFIDYTKYIIEQMGGRGPALDACAREIYEEWAVCHHFSLYEDVPLALGELVAGGVRVGLISNTHRSLESFQRHFELEGLIDAAISSLEHGYMKPHPSIFEAALRLLDVRPTEAMMVGDSVKQDIVGARGVGMRGVLVRRSEDGAAAAQHEEAENLDGVAIIRTLAELPPLL